MASNQKATTTEVERLTPLDTIKQKSNASLGAKAEEVLRHFLDSQLGSAPLLAVSYEDFRRFRAIPRSNHGLAKPFPPRGSHSHFAKLVFISHRWLRPNAGHPDDTDCSKYSLILKGLKMLADKMSWNLWKDVYVWVDFACVNQDDSTLQMAHIKSLLAYVARSDALLIPASQGYNTWALSDSVDDVNVYSERAWCRLESFVMWVVGLLRGMADPPIFVTTDNPVKVKCLKYNYEPSSLPSGGLLHSEVDRDLIRVHEKVVADAYYVFLVCAKVPATAVVADLSNTFLEGASAMEALSDRLSECAKLTWLNLCRNKIGDKGVKALARALGKLVTLRRLGIDFYDITNEGTKALSLRLGELTALETFDMCNITEEKAKALVPTLCKLPMLRSINLFDPSQELYRTTDNVNVNCQAMYDLSEDMNKAIISGCTDGEVFKVLRDALHGVEVNMTPANSSGRVKVSNFASF